MGDAVNVPVVNVRPGDPVTNVLEWLGDSVAGLAARVLGRAGGLSLVDDGAFLSPEGYGLQNLEAVLDLGGEGLRERMRERGSDVGFLGVALAVGAALSIFSPMVGVAAVLAALVWWFA